MAARLIGAHMSTSGGIGNALREGKKIGCAAVQVFTASPRQWKSKAVTGEMVADLDRARQETGITAVVSHDSYLVNLCAPTEEIRFKSYESLKEELLRCSLLGIPYVVSHMGSAKDQTEEEALRTTGEATRRLLGETPDNVTLLMETTAGQGSSLNYRFEHLATLLELCQGHRRLGVCLDTCHVFAAGYDIRTEEGYELTMIGFDAMVGLDRLKAIHANDSMRPFASKLDRHEHIGKGEIGETAFRCLVNDPRFDDTPILLETNDGETMHAVNLATLRSFRA
ncbi:MAG: deoxyribonuclease IV [Fimbriimonadaceae bacterium]|nr:deoxyribonuclease IV [Fimbriimonadaceae bacterium]